MQLPPIPSNEEARLKTLEEFKVLDTIEEEEFDDLTLLASQICDTPVALISLVDEKRQWFKSHYGLDIRESKREDAFCAHAINFPNEIYEIEDATEDTRFVDNPFVTGDSHLRFYAGSPIVTENGSAIGTLCVIDSKRKKLSEDQKTALKALGRIVLKRLNSRKKIIEEINSKASLSSENSLLNSIVSGIPEGVVVVDKQGEFIHFNERALKMVGLKRSEVNAQVVRDSFNVYLADRKTKVELHEMPSSLALKGESVADVEYYLTRSDSQPGKFYRFSSTPLRNKEGEIFAALVIAKDVNHLREIDFELNKSTTLFNQSQKLAKIGHWEVDLELNTLTWSQVVREIHEVEDDYVPNLAEGINFYDENSRSIISELVENAITKKESWDVKLCIITAKGNTKWVRSIGKPYTVHGKVEQLYGVFQDITEEKLALDKLLQRQNSIEQLNSNLEEQVAQKAQELTQSKQEFKSLYNNAPDIMLTINMVEKVVSQCNNTALHILGYKKSELIGKKLIDLYYTDSEKQMLTALETFKKKGTIKDQRLSLITKKGKIIPVILNATAVKNKNGDIIESNSVLRDISKLVLAEQKLLATNQLLENKVSQRTQDLKRKNEELEDFTYIATHDLKMPLANIKGHLEIVELELENPSNDLLKSVDWIKESVKVADQKIQNIIDIARFTAVYKDNFENIDLVELIENQKANIVQSSEDVISSFTYNVVGKKNVLSNKILLSSIVQNIIQNSIKYRKKDKKVNIEININNNLADTKISIKDDGIGIDLKKDKNKLFKMFSRLNVKEEGSGIGLYLSKKMIENLGGKLSVESELNVGSTFILEFPKPKKP